MEDDLKQTLTRGLTSSRRYIPSWYNYDETGSKLHHIFATENPNYYFTRSQVSVLQGNIQAMIPRVPYDVSLVDLGSGNCSKTRYVIDELLKSQKHLSFYPVDVSEDFLMASVKKLSKEYGDSLDVKPIAEDYVKAIQELRMKGEPKIILCFGSFINLTSAEQVNILSKISTIMTDRCRLVFSADITQDKETVIKAYNDDQGIARAFIQNAVVRLNKETRSKIDLTRFTYEVDFVCNKEPHLLSYIKVYMQAQENIQYPIPGLGIDLVMEKGERLYFHERDGFCYKYTLEQLQHIVEKAGLRLKDTWSDNYKHTVFCQCVSSNADVQ